MLGSKAVTGIVPFLGAVAGGAINAHFVNKFADAAETYYRAKLAYPGGPAGDVRVPVETACCRPRELGDGKGRPTRDRARS